MAARCYRSLLVALVVLVGASPLSAQSGPEAAYYKACFQQNEERDFAAAASLFEEVAQSSEAPADIRQAAARRLAECREELAARDLAGLMPADAIAYVQLANIGSQAQTVLETLGLAGDESDDRSEASRIPIEQGLSFPVDFALSPALVREIAKLGGVAAALTGFGEDGIPQGVVVVHIGDSDLVRGLLETGIQIVTPNEAIEGYATYQIPADGASVWLAQTERLLVMSPSREQIAGVVSRLRGGAGGDSLKESASFREVADARESSLLFAWADSQRAAPLIDAAMQSEMQDQEQAVARTVLNLQAIQCAFVSVSATDGGLRAEAAVRFQPDHQHLIYGLLRTAPIGEEALRHVPSGSAVVAAIGLNPVAKVSASDDSQAPPQLALMDLGREFFANVRSASIFAVPGEGPMPEAGVVLYAQDAAKSKQLWSRLMALPAMFGLVPQEAASETTIAGRPATQYVYPGVPPILVSQPSDDALVIGTAGAVTASLEAAQGDSAGATRLLEHANAATSKALFLQFGPMARCAASAARGPEREHIAAIAPLIEDTTASLTIDEDPNELRVRVQIAGVPRVADVLKAIGPQIGGRTSPAENFQATAPGR